MNKLWTGTEVPPRVIVIAMLILNGYTLWATNHWFEVKEKKIIEDVRRSDLWAIEALDRQWMARYCRDVINERIAAAIASKKDSIIIPKMCRQIVEAASAKK